MARRRRSPLERFLRRNPVVAAAAVVGGGAGWAWDGYVLDVSDRTQLYVSVAVAVAVLLGRVLPWRRIRPGSLPGNLRRGYSAVYVFYGLDPWDGYRSETCIYVGETSQAPWTDGAGVVHYPRQEQHMLGGGRYGSAAKSWSDTVTRWHFAHETWRGIKAVRMAREKRLCHRLRPLYNHEYNLNNPRRISIPDQQAQRAQRDAMRVGDYH